MKVRPNRRLLDEAMKEVKEIEPTRTALTEWATELLGEMAPPNVADITVNPYGTYDERIGWNTHIVVLPGWGVLGFTDGPLVD